MRRVRATFPEKEYRKSIDEVVRFLNGNYDPILKELEEKMLDASENLEFEKAIEYRELLASVQKIAQKQKITDTAGTTGILLQWLRKVRTRLYKSSLSGEEG